MLLNKFYFFIYKNLKIKQLQNIIAIHTFILIILHFSFISNGFFLV